MMTRFQQLSLLLIAVFGHTTMYSIEFSPWYGELLELDTSETTRVEYYQKFATTKHSKYQSHCDSFFKFDAAMVPVEEWAIELGTITALTRHRSFEWDSILLTGRTQWTNDIVGDFASISTGLTISQVFKDGLHNISDFYHGGIQGEAHVSVGKELSCGEFWTSRVWGVFGIGIADLGSPWLRGDITYEANWWDNDQWSLFVRSLWGCGGNRLNPAHFRGYGPIHHQSIDIGADYAYHLESGLTIGLEYTYRVFANNCPESANNVSIQFSYSFGL